ncbi:MAG: GNAT family N-acetyltransferase [Anaerolineales bacterium]|jgi:hypothetical protein
MEKTEFEIQQLQTAGLFLSALTPDGPQAYLSNIEALEAALGRRLSRPILMPVVRRAISLKLDKMNHTPPNQWAWCTYWLATIVETQFGAGLIGFKGPPDDQGMVEFGYGIDPFVSGHGYTTEAAAAIIEWAFKTPACLRIVAPKTGKDNPASHRVLNKLGMQAYAETEEDISYQLSRRAFFNR